jgi:heme/copper-type cytochrome/quinol oxidase subunit 2
VRGVILVGCGVVAAGVFLTMYVCAWTAHDDPARAPDFRRSILSELIWVSVPIVMLIAAVMPAAISVISGGTAN